MPHAEQQQQQAQSMLGLVQDGQVRQGCVCGRGGSLRGVLQEAHVFEVAEGEAGLRWRESYLSLGPNLPWVSYPRVMPHEEQQQQAPSKLGLVQDGHVRWGR
jgi:hypothetical protein